MLFATVYIIVRQCHFLFPCLSLTLDKAVEMDELNTSKASRPVFSKRVPCFFCLVLCLSRSADGFRRGFKKKHVRTTFVCILFQLAALREETFSGKTLFFLKQLTSIIFDNICEHYKAERVKVIICLCMEEKHLLAYPIQFLHHFMNTSLKT